MRDETFLAGIAILALTVLECFALFLGIDGAYFFPIVSFIAGIGGAGIGYKFKESRVCP